MGGLFLLSRRSQGGMGGPGGNNPLAFGKSKAKFQMEPNTGITFDDVAGVDEAKQDFMEARPGPPSPISYAEVYSHFQQRPQLSSNTPKAFELLPVKKARGSSGELEACGSCAAAFLLSCADGAAASRWWSS